MNTLKFIFVPLFQDSATTELCADKLKLIEYDHKIKHLQSNLKEREKIYLQNEADLKKDLDTLQKKYEVEQRKNEENHQKIKENLAETSSQLAQAQKLLDNENKRYSANIRSQEELSKIIVKLKRDIQDSCRINDEINLELIKSNQDITSKTERLCQTDATITDLKKALETLRIQLSDKNKLCNKFKIRSNHLLKRNQKLKRNIESVSSKGQMSCSQDNHIELNKTSEILEQNLEVHKENTSKIMSEVLVSARAKIIMCKNNLLM